MQIHAPLVAVEPTQSTRKLSKRARPVHSKRPPPVRDHVVRIISGRQSTCHKVPDCKALHGNFHRTLCGTLADGAAQLRGWQIFELLYPLAYGLRMVLYYFLSIGARKKSSIVLRYTYTNLYWDICGRLRKSSEWRGSTIVGSLMGPKRVSFCLCEWSLQWISNER
jgi:hypothetical protein